MDLISVIVPVYKVEKYLDKCVASIVNQTYRNLEIILVDDGSTDNCGAMCDQWAAKDSRIRVIHKENGGLSDARNAGMAAATGNWIAFVDSDDWIAADMYETLRNTARTHDCDVAACAYLQIYPGEEVPKEANSGNVTVLNRTEAMTALIKDGCVRQVVWNKLYAADLVKDIPFAVGKCHEDEFWTYQVIAKMNRYAAVEHVGYYYLQRDGSIMGQKYSRKRLDALEAKQRRHELIVSQMPELAQESLCSLWYDCLYQGQRALLELRGVELAYVLEELKKVQRSHPLPKKKPDSLSEKYWIWFRLARLSLTLTCRVRNVLKIGF